MARDGEGAGRTLSEDSKEGGTNGWVKGGEGVRTWTGPTQRGIPRQPTRCCEVKAGASKGRVLARQGDVAPRHSTNVHDFDTEPLLGGYLSGEPRPLRV
jgi:hypothetical protein